MVTSESPEGPGMDLRPRPSVAPRLARTVFAVWCEDAPAQASEQRARRLQGHTAYIERHFDRYLVAGPLRRDTEEALCGSLFLIYAEDENDARAFMAGDPYFADGLYARVEFRRMTPAAGRWMGGVIWESAEALLPLATGAAPRVGVEPQAHAGPVLRGDG